MNLKKTFVFAVSASLLCAAMAGCSSGKGYSDYAAAYNKITAKGGLDASIKYSVTMDGQTTSGTGVIKMDGSSNTMLYEMSMNDGSKITQFSDGTNMYTDDGETKSKANTGNSSSEENAPQAINEDEVDEEAPTFDSASFVGQFASFMEVGKIREMGLLDPIPSAVVSKTTYKDGVYSLTVDANAISKVLLSSQEEAGVEAPEVSNIKDFTYDATEKDGVIASVKMTGKADVKVPASLMSDSKEANYTLSFTIEFTFNNPGQAVTIALPSTDDYED